MSGKNIIFKIFFLILIGNNIFSNAETKKKGTRGLLPEINNNNEKTTPEANDQKQLNSELLISRTENKAIEALESILKKKKGSPQEADLLNRLAELYMRKSKSGRFFDLQRQNNKNSLSSFPIPDEKGADSIKKALIQYQKILTQFPKFEEYDSVLFNSAFAYQQINEKKKSETNYKNLIESFSNSKLYTDSLIALGELLYDQGKFKEAEAYFEKIEKYPDSKVYSYGIYKLAWTYYNLKDSSKAINMLKTVISKNPATEEAMNKKGYYLRKESLRDMVLFIGEVYAAKDLYQFFKKIATEEELGPVLFDMAKLYDSYAKLKDIHIFLNEFIDKENSNSYIVRSHLLLADTYETLKKRDFVLRHLNLASDLCVIGSDWRAKQTEEEVLKSCHSDFRRATLELAKKWWEIWQKNKAHQEFSELTEKILRLILKNEPIDSPDIKTRMALAELLFQKGDFEQASENYNLASLKAITFISQNRELTPELNENTSLNQKNLATLAHDSTYSALFAKEKSIEKQKTDSKSEQRKDIITRYLKTFPKGDYFYEVNLKLAIIYYEENKLNDSAVILEDLINQKTSQEVKIKAEDLLLDIKNIEKKYSEVKNLSIKFNQSSTDTSRKKILNKIYEESHYFENKEQIKTMDARSSAFKLYEYYQAHPQSELGKQAFLDALNLLIKNRFLIDGTQKTIEFIKTFPEFDKKLLLKKDLITSLIEIGDLTKAAEYLLEISSEDKENKLKNLEAAADFMILDGKMNQARSIYHQLLLELPKDQRSRIFLKIKSSLDQSSNQKEIDKIEKIINELSIEPYVTEGLIKKAQNLFDQKKLTECYELTNKILKRDVDAKYRAKARYLQGLIFEKELFNQSVKTSKEEKIGLIIQIKTERLDKAQTAYLSVTKMTTEKSLLLKAFEGVDRSLNNYILSLSELTPPSSLTEADQQELKKELKKITEPLIEKRKEYVEQIEQLKTYALSSDSNWNDLDPKIPFPINFKKEIQLEYNYLNQNKELKKAYELIRSKERSVKDKEHITPIVSSDYLNKSDFHALGVFYLALEAESKGLKLKANWLLEKLKIDPINKDAIPSIQFAQFVVSNNHRLLDSKYLLEIEKIHSDAIFKLENPHVDYTVFRIWLANAVNDKVNFQKNCQILEQGNLKDIGHALLEYTLPLCVEFFASNKDLQKAENFLNLIPFKNWKQKEYYYLTQARLEELYKNSPKTALNFYEKANKEATLSDMKKWIEKKISLLKLN
ncbi:MAG: tetratricopeptide repeat protein [Bdellovibrionaceae bacterium]|nr:tetratricopeptide repeat protein [Pseudobdellovibrionaceae bacterium]NUM59232.1 tetratricopeptide repeat protein [Pseudobdellovibrionaceae bacterium]